MQKSSSPILIVDKVGILGEGLCQKLAAESLVVYVSQKKPTDDISKNTTFVPYGSNIPIIPGDNYSRMFVVDDGLATTEFLSEFVKKARRDKSQLIFIVNLFNFTSFYNRYKKAQSTDGVKIVIFGDIFDKNIHPSFIDSAIKFGRIEVENDGLSKTYPVFLEDVVSGIIQASFGASSLSSIFYLFPKYPPTQISLARMIQKANPMVQVDFSKTRGRHSGNPSPQFPLPKGEGEGGKYLLADNYSLEKKIKELNIESLMQLNSKATSNINSKTKGINRLPFIALILSLFFLVSLPLISTLAFSFLGFAILGKVKTAIEDGNLSDAQKSAKNARTFFYLAKKASETLLLEARFIGTGSSLKPVIKNISLGQDLSLVATDALNASRILSEVFMGRSINPKEDFVKVTSLLKNATVLFRQNEAEAKSDLAEEVIPKDLRAKIRSMDSVIKILENTLDVLPSIFGFDGKKTYLVLFQNNMELRPGGGFIGSYGLLKLDLGRIEDFSIHDIYDADGQLKEHVEPPFAIRRHLELPHWYLRDSNFDVDFGRSASSAAFLLNKELGQEADGVIGVDVSFVKNILEAVGPVYVADYKETVTSSNLFKLAQSHAEKNFFPGSKQKKDFLKSLFNAMQLNITLRENLPYLSLAKTISESILRKHLLFAFSDKNIQDLFTVNKWSSTSWEVPVGTSSTSINDFLGINEANLGVNKANYFVKRELFHNVDIDDKGNISEMLKIEYKNSSNAWPGGDYLNYLRVILPLNAMLLSISFDGVSQEIVPAVTDARVYEAENFVEPLGLEVEKYDQEGKTIYGFLVNIEAGRSKAIEIKYVLPQKISLNLATFSYKLRFFKQPGTDEYPYSFHLAYPKNLRVISGLPSFSGKIEGDMEFNASFAQK